MRIDEWVVFFLNSQRIKDGRGIFGVGEKKINNEFRLQTFVDDVIRN